MGYNTQIKNKIVDFGELSLLLDQWKNKGLTIVFSNGCFDLLHPGHVDYLSKARNLGDKLIIGLNTDNSVQRLKGENRPIQKETTRAIMLAAFAFVDAVILFDEDTPLQIISKILPDILVKGSDYSVDQIVGSDVVLEHGGRIETIDFLEGFSTSAIIDKIRNMKDL
ncbi:MAG: D-glycero-beta-D-manno-heptose 1-phosphate adenylyltransferase [Bacteroidetes bacterium]|nr:MAG: D-glycero-beta-D-manno-heptose 1-phosphate adenylyltransferase [Bacteroidota bacterium]